ncbi:SRPBCC family protein [Virgibacillus dakarensis]|uniref:SRPBCC family protein n=1 Tax=Virgibacillus dakarensis TaxID=1917889 RepID=UPI001E64E9B3
MFNAPAENVFKAFSDPGLLKKWWGPKGFSNTIHEFDMRLGGIWRYVMHGPNGVDYENKSEFIEINYNERIVLRHLEPDHKFLLEITFKKIKNKTEIIWRMIFDTEKEYEEAKPFVKEANEQNLDHLEWLLNEVT